MILIEVGNNAAETMERQITINMKIFSGGSNPILTTRICDYLGIRPGHIYRHTFPSGEKYVQFKENIRGEDVFLVQSASNPANDNLMELLVMADAARRASAKRITAVCPWLPYSRSDRKDHSRIAISSKLILNMFKAAGINRIMSVDLHAPSVQGMTDEPFDNLYALPTLIKEFIEKYGKRLVLVAPDIGATKKVDALAKAFGLSFAFIVKKRLNDSEVCVEGFIGDVKNRPVLICDDLSESCGTILAAAKICDENGATGIHAGIVHPMFSEEGYTRLEKDVYLSSLLTTDTVAMNRPCNKIKTKSIAPVIAEAIKRTHNNESISSLFEIEGY